MAASMWPVMSKSPGEGCVPPLTVPPLPGAGVVGVVVPPGRPGCPVGPLPEPRVAGRRAVVVVEVAAVSAVSTTAIGMPRSWRSVRVVGCAADAERQHGDEGEPGDEQRPAPPGTRRRRSDQSGDHAHPPTIEARIETSSGARMASA